MTGRGQGEAGGMIPSARCGLRIGTDKELDRKTVSDQKETKLPAGIKGRI